MQPGNKGTIADRVGAGQIADARNLDETKE
jgi:hypothetical protein